MKDEIKSPADLLEQALLDLENRKKAAADKSAEMAPELERLAALQAKLEALPQKERREVLDAMGLKHVSAAPPPITPVRGTGRAPFRQPSPANWNKWKFIPKCELWKGVCLSLDIEPDEEKHGMRSWLQSRLGVPYGFPADFAERLQIAQANVSTNGPIQPQNLYVGALNNPHAEVLLSEVSAAAICWGWTLPECMKALARSGEPVTTPKPSATKFPPMVPATDAKPWLLIEPSDPAPEHEWYAPARYFARQLVSKDSTLLTKKLMLADKVSLSLSSVGIYRRGGKKQRLDASTVLKAFSNMTWG